MSDTKENISLMVMPGTEIRIDAGREARRYTIHFGEYGSLTFDAVIGSTAVLVCGTRAPRVYVHDPETGAQTLRNVKGRGGERGGPKGSAA